MNYVEYDPLKILNDEIAARKQQIARTTAKYLALKQELIKKINDLKEQTEKDKETMKNETEQKIQELTESFQQKIEKMKKDNADRIFQIENSVTPDYTTESRIENTNDQLVKLDKEYKEKSYFLEESTKNELCNIESESSRLKRRSDKLSRKISQIEAESVVDSPNKNEHIKKINKRMSKLASDIKSYQVAFDVRCQKYENSEKNTREVFKYELRKLRRQIKECKDRIEMEVSLISNSQLDHAAKIKKLKKDIYSLTMSPKSPNTSSKPKIKRIPEKIQFFESCIRDNRTELSLRKEKLRKLQEKNRILSFQIRKLNFHLSGVK